MAKKTLEELMSRQREVNNSLGTIEATLQTRELNDEEKKDQGINENTIRLSIGTENIADIIEDLDEAFKALR